MTTRLRFAPALAAASLLLVSPSHEAKACGGGMFSPPAEMETTKVTGHRVAIAISTTQTVLWDQVQYAGDPEDFAWVMPVMSGARLETASAAWIDVLDAGTATVVSSPEVFCDEGGSGSESSGGCCGTALRDGGGSLGGGDSERDPNVTVLSSGSVGPYDTVTLKSDVPGAINKWLTDNGYAIPAAMQPILDDYTSKGFDFIAARLKPGAGLDQMKPLRVVTPGALTTFPMRMLAAGASANVGIQLFVLTEGRMNVKGFPGRTIDPAKVTWDFKTHSSDYADVRAATLAEGEGRTWLSSYARKQGLFLTAEPNGITLSDKSLKATIAEAYFAQGKLLGDTSDLCGFGTDFTDGMRDEKVVDVCPPDGSPCGTPDVGEMDSRVFSCGKLDDLEVAMTGMHPISLWLNRFEANLPVAALSQDLTLEPVAVQTPISNSIVAGESDGSPCTEGAALLLGPSTTTRARPPSSRDRNALLVAMGALGLALARRTLKRRPVTAGARSPAFG